MPSVPPAGTSPASAYTILSFAPPQPPPAILADKIDAVTGEFLSLLEGHTIADGFATEALRIQRATGAAARDLGNRFRELTHVDDKSLEQVESMARDAFKPAEEAGVARLIRVTREPDETDPSQINTAVEFRDLLAPPASQLRRLVFPR